MIEVTMTMIMMMTMATVMLINQLLNSLVDQLNQSNHSFILHTLLSTGSSL